MRLIEFGPWEIKLISFELPFFSGYSFSVGVNVNGIFKVSVWEPWGASAKSMTVSCAQKEARTSMKSWGAHFLTRALEENYPHSLSWHTSLGGLFYSILGPEKKSNCRFAALALWSAIDIPNSGRLPNHNGIFNLPPATLQINLLQPTLEQTLCTHASWPLRKGLEQHKLCKGK